MDHHSLAGFAASVRETRRIRFGDVRRLCRDLLGGRVPDRAELELLLSLDRDVGRPDPSWNEFLARAARERVLCEGEEALVWLAEVLGPRPTRRGQAILESARRALAEEPALADAPTLVPAGPEDDGLAPECGLAGVEVDPPTLEAQAAEGIRR